ncbi:hypothetical protein N7G274_002636 [Stereocaulon virgatum]|uniref:Fe2OG dioxygenase domain-containing protein n=1 Tax=Stereocaulon virgatum TaxID=373712 RepID=A0ABR4AH70_9LECA
MISRLMAQGDALDARERPPAFIKSVYKFYRKLSKNAFTSDAGVLDLSLGLSPANCSMVKKVDKLLRSTVYAACCHLRDGNGLASLMLGSDVEVYEARNIPGLLLIPSLVPRETQRHLLSKVLHRDLSDARHRTNVHLHHQLPYNAVQRCFPHSSELESASRALSFFNLSPTSSDLFLPVDDSIHKPLTVSQFLGRKLRWMTLGDQYDWTQKCYLLDNPPFPADIAAFVHGLFPEMVAEAAIVNVYTPGDTLSMHRDVSEKCERGLVSISLGCDGVFVVGLGSEKDGNEKSLVVRLRSGDAVFMTGPSRFAWHGVPQILPDTCPEWLRPWPATPMSDLDQDRNDPYNAWRGWISNKRINLNVRQMRD